MSVCGTVVVGGTVVGGTVVGGTVVGGTVVGIVVGCTVVVVGQHPLSIFKPCMDGDVVPI